MSKLDYRKKLAIALLPRRNKKGGGLALTNIYGDPAGRIDYELFYC